MPFYCESPACEAILDAYWKRFCLRHYWEEQEALKNGIDGRNSNNKVWFYQLQGGLCNYCGNRFSIDYLVWEHLTPPNRGGSNAVSNLQLTCPPCNGKKYVRKDREFRNDNATVLPQKPRTPCTPPINSQDLRRKINWRRLWKRKAKQPSSRSKGYGHSRGSQRNSGTQRNRRYPRSRY